MHRIFCNEPMEILPAEIFMFILVLTRVSTFFLVCPIFSAQAVPVRIKLGLILAISIFCSFYLPTEIKPYAPQLLEAVIALCWQGLCGFFIGYVVFCIFSTIKIAGAMAEREMGLSMAEVLDPLSGENAQPVAIMLEMLFILFMLAADGHLLMLNLLYKSFAVFSPADIGSPVQLLDTVITASSAMLVAALRLAAPLMAAFMLLMITLAVMARIAPEMNILFISFPLKISLGMVLLIIFVPFISSFVNIFADWMAKLLPM